MDSQIIKSQLILLKSQIQAGDTTSQTLMKVKQLILLCFPQDAINNENAIITLSRLILQGKL